jgi:ketol-acid reductoisomerase
MDERIYRDEDASLKPIEKRTIAVIGYGSQGRAQALNLKDSGLSVVVGLREGGNSWIRAKEDGLEAVTLAQAAKRGDIVHILIPDEVQAEVYRKEVEPNLAEGKTLCFSHGFNIAYGLIVPSQKVDVIMVAPKAPGSMVRKLYLDGFGTPALIAVDRDFTGKAKETALAMAKAMHFTRAGVIETTFWEETTSDLFGEQAVLCGGVTELIKAGFETLVQDGYQSELAYFECLNELKLIVDLFYEGGLGLMWRSVSNTAEYGGRTRGKRIVTEQTREEMQKLLGEIKSGKFTEEWVEENARGAPLLKKAREEEKKELIEVVGKRVRELYSQKPPDLSTEKRS